MNGLTNFLISVAGYVGFFYLIYASLRSRMLRHYHNQPMTDPWPMFGRAWLSTPAWFLIVYFCLVFFTILFVMISKTPFIAMVAGIGIVGGGWIWLLFDFTRRLKGQHAKAYWERHPPPKLQFSMMDIYLATAVYMVTIGFFAAPASYTDADQAELMAASAYFLFGQGIAFYFALDVLRHSQRLKKTVHRVLFITTLMLYSAFFWPFTWMSWRAWRFCLWKLGERREELARINLIRPGQPNPVASNFPPLPPYPGDPAQPG